jgi:hypothetical protein
MRLRVGTALFGSLRAPAAHIYGAETQRVVDIYTGWAVNRAACRFCGWDREMRQEREKELFIFYLGEFD